MGALAKILEESTLRQSDNIRQRQIARQNVGSDSCLTTSELARELGMPVRRLYRQLVGEGVLRREDGRYRLTPDYEDMGLTRERTFHYYSLEGEKLERVYLVWTPQGANLVRSMDY